LLNLEETVNSEDDAKFPVEYNARTFPNIGFDLNKSQVNAVNQCF